MSLSFPRIKPRYKTVDGILYRIKRKRTYLGMEEKLEAVDSKVMFPKGGPLSAWSPVMVECTTFLRKTSITACAELHQTTTIQKSDST